MSYNDSVWTIGTHYCKLYNAILENPNKNKYQNQKIYIIECKNYIYVVLFVKMREDEEKEKKIAREAAERTIRKDKRMNIRISERDLRNLKIRALEEGVPYQTLVSMRLHKYLSGKLKDETA